MKTATTDFPSPRRERGVALMFALLLLVVLTILGIATMSNVAMQERMAGNVNLQTLAFEAASAGVAQSLVYGLNKDNWDGDCARNSDDRWITDWTAFTPIGANPAPGIQTAFRQRIGCFEPEDIPDEWTDPDIDFKVPVQLLVLNQGVARRLENGTAGEVLAMREIEVRVENRGGDPQCAIRVEGDVDSVSAAKGNFSIDGGEGGCPISLSPGGGAQDLIDEIGDNFIGQYQPDPPGIHESPGVAPWNDPVEFAKIANELKIGVLAWEDWQASGDTLGVWSGELPNRINAANAGGDTDLAERLQAFLDFEGDVSMCKGTFYEGSSRIGTGGIPGGQCDVDWGASSNGSPSQRFRNTNIQVGDPSDPFHITYVAGHLGNPSNNSGSGIVVTEGGMCWSGTADFTGLQLILGGHFEIIGGGTGDTTGSITLTKLEDRYGTSPPANPDFWGWTGDELLARPYFGPEEAYFDSSDLFFAGGGGHSITFKCGGKPGETGLFDYIGKINACTGRDIEPNCDPDALGFRRAIASWREYIDGQRWGQ